MKVSTGNAHAEIARQFVITENHPVVPMAYSSQPKQVRIERGVINYVWKDGAWIVSSPYSVSVSGAVLKKDGTPGQNDHSRRGPDIYYGEAAWPWLNDIIELLRPNGDLTMTTLREHEVSK